jgi:hypothetical protein
MYGMNSDLICRVIGNYRFSNDDADYRRYLQLEDLLGGGSPVGSVPVSEEMSREAFQEGEDPETDIELEKSKEKKLKGGGGVSTGVSRMFRDILKPYTPGGYFTWEKYASDLAENFYRMAYAQFKDLLPKLISSKLKKFNVDRSEGSIETDPETINKVIMDSLVYLHDHPDMLKDGLVRAYRRREDEENRGVGIADAFFVPRISASALAERLKVEPDYDAKEGDTDEEVLESLKDRGDVKWKWRGIDEYGVLRFTLPDLYGSREFTVKLPAEIQTIKPGTYTFRVKDVIDSRGAVLEFKEQHESISGNALENIEADGLGEDQLRKFINNGVINRYITFLRSQPAEKLAEDYLGAFTVGPNQISSADDLAELIKLEGGSEETSKGRGKERVKEKYQESVKRQQEKLQAMIQRWQRAPEVAKHFMKVTEADGAQIARVVASKFPQISEKLIPSLASILATAPVVEMVLRYIMSPHMPLAGGGKSMPWVHFAWEAFQKMAIYDPKIRLSMETMVRNKRKDPTPGMPASDEEISTLLSTTSPNVISARFGDLRDKISEIVTASRGAPELKKFFERREVFQSYIQNQLQGAVEQYMKDNELSLDSPEDMAKIEKFKDKYIKKAVDKMSKSAGQAVLLHQLMVRMSA